jgi:hypothetical protein
LLDHVEVREVVGRERFSLDYGEVDLYLIEPRRMDRGMHHDRIGELLGEPVDGPLSPVGRAVVDHPEHAVRGHGPYRILHLGLTRCPRLKSVP